MNWKNVKLIRRQFKLVKLLAKNPTSYVKEFMIN